MSSMDKLPELVSQGVIADRLRARLARAEELLDQASDIIEPWCYPTWHANYDAFVEESEQKK